MPAGHRAGPANPLSVRAAGLRNQFWKTSIMAFATETFNDTNPFRGFAFRPGKARGAIASALIIGFGTVAFAWTVATVATMQTVGLSLGTSSIMLPEASLGPKSIALTNPQQRLMHMAGLSGSSAERAAQYRLNSRTSRIAGAAVEQASNLSSDLQASTRGARPALPDAARKQLILRLAMANAASSPARDVAALEPAIRTAAASLEHPQRIAEEDAAPTRVKDDAVVVASLPAAVPVPTAAEIAEALPKQPGAIGQEHPHPLVLASATPSKSLPDVEHALPTASATQTIAAAAEPALTQQSGLAPASAAPARNESVPAIALPIPSARPERTDGIAVASAELSPSDDGDAEQVAAAEDPFSLVLTNPDGSIPLPMARPDGVPGSLAAAPAGRSRSAAEPALAYARTDDDDDDDSDMPTYKKPLSVPVARDGVAIYDISAGTVYLPGGERLEAHSGLGNMRDNPRYVNQKNRGPTPPHTYDLTLRESLFHGVQAIRLTPIGGQGAVYNRDGLLAHTYMLGKRGDSNGCVSFKDYRRFLAAYRRGEIKRLVVVPRLTDSAYASASAAPPRSLFGGLFSR